MTREKQCAGCGEPITSNHAVRDGEPFCFDCETPLHACAAGDHSDADPQTIEEYEASKATIVSVGALMNGGEL